MNTDPGFLTRSRLHRPGLTFLCGLALAAGAGLFWICPVQAQALIAGDLDGDGDVDVNDANLFIGCLSGAELPHENSLTCDLSDIDHDNDVDLSDFGAIQVCLTGPGNPGSLTCGGCVRPRTDRPAGVLNSPIGVYQSTFITVGNSQVGANYQLRNHANNANVNSPVAGTGGTINLPTSDLPSTTTFNILATNAAWGCSAQLATTLTVTVNPYVPHNKLGLHVVDSLPDGPPPTVPMERTAFINFLSTCAAAGKPVAVVKCLDDFTQAHDTKQYSPQTLTIGRLNTSAGGDDLGGLDYLVNAGVSPQDGAAWYYTLVKQKWQANPWVDVWEMCNEWSNWRKADGTIQTWQADFYLAMMDLAEADGFRLGLWAASVGNPPTYFYPEIYRTCVRAKAHGNHILCLHEYGLYSALPDAPPSLVTRYRQLYNYLATQTPPAVIPLAITEVADGGCGLESVDHAFWYDTQLRQDGYVIGFTLFTLDFIGGWSGCDFMGMLPAMADYIVAH